tara:strand:+ start:8700 stop:9296 length:597 start_codon:yes stop_codon:yes gene_type:complete
MKATEILSKAKELLSIDAEVEEVKLAQATLENGTVIESESFEAGAEVFIVTEDEKVALPVGDYTLEDGELLKVEEEGIIASIGAAEEEEEPAEEVEAAEEEKEEMQYATKEELSEVKEMIEEIKAMIKDKEEMSSEEPQEEVQEEPVAEELSAVEEPVEKVNHNPEAEADTANLKLYAQKRVTTTFDRVLNKIGNFNK